MDYINKSFYRNSLADIELWEYCSNIIEGTKKYFYKDLEELLLSQPVTFENNKNYLYNYILYLYANDLIKYQNNYEYISQIQFGTKLLIDYINNLENYSENKR